MPRTARIKSNSGIYHIMLRGVDRKQIFFDDEDSKYFINLLERYKSVSGYELYAYCLMGNHIHLLLKEGTESLDIIFRRIGAAYVWWYNLKYERVGHVFQDRFKSEPVDTERYLLTVLRYILQNPVAAGICDKPEEYSLSSAKEYLERAEGISDTAYIFSIIDYESLKEFISQKNSDSCLEIEERKRRGVTDAVAIEWIMKEFGTLTPDAGSKKTRNGFTDSVVRLLRKGISVRQMSRLTGISRGILQRCTGNK